MRKTLLLTICLLAAVAVVLPASAALGADEGIISGQVVNKTPGGSPVAGLEVTLTTYSNDKTTSEQKVIADSTGKFEFKGLSLDPSNAYSVKTNFREADYSSDMLRLKADSPLQTVELAVYEATATDEKIQVSNGHIVMVADQGFLQVLEVWRFNNTGDRTYIGTKGKTARATLKFTLPQGATSVESAQGFAYETSSDGIVSTASVPPGVTDVSFSYVIPYQGSNTKLLRRTDYAVANFGLFVQDTGVQVKSAALTRKNTQDLNGTKYLYFTAQNLSRGAELDASLGGLAKPIGSAPGESLPWPWLAAGVLGLGAIVVVAYPRLRKRQTLATSLADDTPASANQTNDDENALLRELARLDDNYESGKLKETEYRARRAQTKARLMGIYALTEGQTTLRNGSKPQDYPS